MHDAAAVITSGPEPRTAAQALHQICISPQCGFASHSEGNNVSHDDIVKKLALVVETARELWPGEL